MVRSDLMDLAAAAYDTFFAYYHDAPAWDTLSPEKQQVWVMIVRRVLDASN